MSYEEVMSEDYAKLNTYDSTYYILKSKVSSVEIAETGEVKVICDGVLLDLSGTGTHILHELGIKTIVEGADK